MAIEEFRQLDQVNRAEKPWLSLHPLHRIPDRPASIEQIRTVEDLVGATLPAGYKDFLREFGGGEFGYSTIFSADPISDWYLPIQASNANRWLPKDLLAISDDFCGGNYVLAVQNGIAIEPVLYWNTDGGLVPTEHGTVLDFIAHDAYGTD